MSTPEPKSRDGVENNTIRRAPHITYLIYETHTKSFFFFLSEKIHTAAGRRHTRTRNNSNNNIIIIFLAAVAERINSLYTSPTCPSPHV